MLRDEKIVDLRLRAWQGIWRLGVSANNAGTSRNMHKTLADLGMLENTEPRVAAAIHVMEQHIDAPVAIEAIAGQIKLSVRMLEYLFRKTLDMSPAAYRQKILGV